MRMDTGSSSERTEHSRGGHPCNLRPRRRETCADASLFFREERLRRAPFLTVLGERERERESERSSEREREREREKEGERERERAWYPRAGAVCSAIVAHRTISQVRPAHHTVILESLQRRAFYPRPRRPHVAVRCALVLCALCAILFLKKKYQKIRGVARIPIRMHTDTDSH